MVGKYSKIDITNDLRTKYKGCLRPEVDSISICQSSEGIWLETVSTTIIKDKGWKKETINRVSLNFIFEGDDVAMFDPCDDVEVIAGKLITGLPPYLSIISTDLFTGEASEAIKKNHNSHGLDN